MPRAKRTRRSVCRWPGAFHSAAVAPAREPLAQALAEARLRPPGRPVTERDRGQIHRRRRGYPGTLVDDLTSRPLPRAGGGDEPGRRTDLRGSGTQGDSDRARGPDLARSASPGDAVRRPWSTRPGPLLHLVARLATHGVVVQPERLFRGRVAAPIDLDRFSSETGRPKLSPTTWIINSVRNRPLDCAGATPPRPGQAARRAGLGRIGPVMPVGPVTSAEPASSAPLTRAHIANANGKPQGNSAPFHPSGRIPSLASAVDATQVMLRYQDLMERFLESQHSLMSIYLSGSDAPDPGLLLPLTKFEEANGHHPNPLFGPASPSSEGTPPHAPAGGSEAAADPDQAPIVRYDRERLTDRLLGLVSQRTGYPKDMLGLDVDLEADLGIDSIKRIEILSEVTSDLGTDAQSMATDLEMEKLTVIRTLRGIIDYLDHALSARCRFRSVGSGWSHIRHQAAGVQRARFGLG